ncbi:MAG TPA: hypothetical protein PLK94_00220 [Alphaproteobacteria bacterium]|nr:hypothetical protein [Alphaproteobacteria bacterium]
MASISDSKLYVNIIPTKNRPRKCEITQLLNLQESVALQIADFLEAYSSKYSTTTEGKVLSQILRHLGEFAKVTTADFSSSEMTYEFFYSFREYWYTTSNIDKDISSRNSSWVRLIKFVRSLIKKNILPDFSIPSGNSKLENRNVFEKKKIVINKSGKPELIKEDFVSKALVPISLSRNDDNYLDDCETFLKKASNDFLEASRSEIRDIEKDIEEGDKLIKSVDFSDLNRRIEESKLTKHAYCESIKGKVKPIHFFGHKHPQAIENTLSWIKNQYGGFIRCLEDMHSHADPAMRRMDTLHKIITRNKLFAYLGLLTSRKAIPFFVLLMSKNPKFNVESLANVDAFGKNNINSLLSTAGDTADSIRLTLNKPRAKVMKSSILDNECRKIVYLVLKMTKPYRQYLKKVNDPNYKKLWLAPASCGGHPKPISPDTFRVLFSGYANSMKRGRQLKNGKQAMGVSSFIMSHERLHTYIGTATLAGIRVTAGILKWFSTGGSISAAARTLGNSVRVAMDHYIPRPLQEAMNRRTIRRFQNLLILSATAGEKHMFAATDFKSVGDVHDFLEQMLSGERAKENDLLNYLDNKLNNTNTDCEVVLRDDKKVIISLCERSLSLLFLYQEHLESLNHEVIKLNSFDCETNTSPLFWLELGRILHYHLPNCSYQRELQSIYHNSIALMDEIRGTVTFPQI